MKEEKFPNLRKPSHWQVCREFWNLRGQQTWEVKKKTKQKKKKTKKNLIEYALNCNSQWRSSTDAHVHCQRWGAEQEGVGCMLRVRTRPEYPEDNLRELM